MAEERPTEAGHWYYEDGQPAYTIIGKNGKERNTTLRDARKLNLKPSVTTIIKEAAKLGLENWKAEQLLMAALTLPRIDGETEAAWLQRVRQDAQEQAKVAREKGTYIHSIVQGGFENKALSESDFKYYDVAREVLGMEGLHLHQWVCEKSFATVLYGGKVDLHCKMDYEEIIIDIKTTDKPISTCKIWDEHLMQLAAYQYGLCFYTARCAILFINTQAEAKLVWADAKDINRGWRMFDSLLHYWYAKTGLNEDV